MAVPDSGYSQEWIKRNYQAYLQTQHWRNTRRRYRNSKNKWECFCCGNSENLQLHHRSYKRVGRERLGDLIPLCESCHKRIHREISHKRGTRMWGSALWNAASFLRRKIKEERKELSIALRARKNSLVAPCGATKNSNGHPFIRKGLEDHKKNCPACLGIGTRKANDSLFDPLALPEGFVEPERTIQQQEIHKQLQQLLLALHPERSGGLALHPERSGGKGLR